MHFLPSQSGHEGLARTKAPAYGGLQGLSRPKGCEATAWEAASNHWDAGKAAGCSLVPGFLVGSLFTMYLASAQALLAGSKHRLVSSFKGYVYITVELWGLSGP